MSYILLNKGIIKLFNNILYSYVLMMLIGMAPVSYASEKDNWVQFPPKATSLPLEIQQKPELLKNVAIDYTQAKTANPTQARIQYSIPLTDKPKLSEQLTFKGGKQTIVTTYGDGSTSTEVITAVGQQVQWMADKTTRLTTYRFLNGRTHTEKEIIPAVISKPAYKGDLQTILTTFGDGTVKTQQNKAIKQRSAWSEDKKTKTTTFTFEDASEHVELQKFPPTVSSPTYKGNTKTQTIVYGDESTQLIVEKATSEKTTWSADKIKKSTSYGFKDGYIHIENNTIPPVKSDPTFDGNKQIIVTTYGDGSTSSEVNTAVGQQVQWLADKTTRLTIYRFSDGRSHTEKEIVPAVISKPTYKGDLQTILTTFGDGTVEAQQNKATKQRSEWSGDKKTKTTTFTFEDASEHVDLQYSPPTFGAPAFKGNTKTQTIVYGDGSTENKTVLADSEHITWSADKLVRTSLFTFPDGSQHVEKNHIPALYSTPTYRGDQQLITITYGDGTESQLINKALRTSNKWQHDKVTRLSEHYFPDGTIHVETERLMPANDPPIYKGNQQTIVTKFPDGSKEKLVTHAITEKIDWADDRETKLITYEFPDGSYHQEYMMVKKLTEPAKFSPQEKILITQYGDGTSSKSVIKKINEEEFISKTGTSKTVKRSYADGSFHFFEYLLNETDQWVPKMASVADINNKRTQIFIKDFTFSGNTVIPDQRLRKEVANWINKPSDLNSLGHAVLAISNFYKDSGWLATADLPEQDLKEGMVHIHVTEARFGGVVVDQRNLGNIDPSLPLRKIEAANVKGQVLSLDAVENTTLMISEVPGVQASVSLVAGEKDGETQISLELDKAKTTEMTVSTDNAGARSTGQERQLFQLSLNGLFQQGEVMQLQAMRSEGSEFSRFGINKIIHPNGLRLGINTSAMKYQLITPEYMSINAHGPSNSTGFDLMWPVLRNKSSTLSIQLNADDKKFNNETSLGATSKYQGKIYSLSLQGSTSAWSLGRGLTSASIQVSQGELDFSQSPDQVQDANGLQLAGLFQKIKMSASHAHKINARNNLTTSFQAQWASKNLDGSEKIYLGGPLGIRAYPTNESGGSLGQMLNIEWQHSLPVDIGTMTLAGFYDAGLTVINKFNNYPGALGLNAYGLKGGGMWWGWSIPNSLGMANLKLTWARRMGENPAKNSLGNDQDGSYVLDRFWLTLLQSF